MFPNQFGQKMSDRSPVEASSSDGGYATAGNGGGSTDGSEASDKQPTTERW